VPLLPVASSVTLPLPVDWMVAVPSRTRPPRRVSEPVLAAVVPTVRLALVVTAWVAEVYSNR
jgi:hypothetical protein